MSLPSGYKKIEYIESTGSQYVNTQFYPNQNTRVVLDFQITALLGGWQGIMGARDGSDYNNSFSLWVAPGNTFLTHFGPNSGIGFGVVDTQRHVLDKNREVTTCDGAEAVNPYVTFSCNYPMFIATGCSAGSPDQPAYMRIFSCQIYDNDVLARDFVPVFDVETGEAGLFDKIGGVFYPSAWYGKFVAGPIEILPPENLVAVTSLDVGVSLSWDAVYGATGYRIYKNGTFLTEVSETSFVDTSVSSGVWYQYFVMGLDSGLEGPAATVFSIIESAQLVTDRTQSDVERVRTLSAKGWAGMNAAERSEWLAGLKGAYNCTDLNRVTAAMDDLKARLESYGYSVPGYKKIEIPHNDTQPTSRLPAGHTQLEYIESSGTQYIDTLFKPNHNTRLVVTFQTTETDPSAGVVSVDDGWLNNGFAVFAAYLEYKNSFTAYPLNDGNKHTVEVKEGGKFFVDGVLVWDAASSEFQTVSNLTLFCLNRNGSKEYFSSSSIYSCQVYDNGVLVRDYIPDMTDDGQVGLYDLLDGKFYHNAGTGTFAAGPVVEQEPPSVDGDTEKDPYLWYTDDIPTTAQMNYYLSNVSAIRSVLGVLPTTPQTPADMDLFTWMEANDIEQILTDVSFLLKNVVFAFLYSGEFYSGEV